MFDNRPYWYVADHGMNVTIRQVASTCTVDMGQVYICYITVAVFITPLIMGLFSCDRATHEMRNIIQSAEREFRCGKNYLLLV